MIADLINIIVEYVYIDVIVTEFPKEIEEFFKDIDWNIIFKNKNISEQFIEKYINNISEYESNNVIEWETACYYMSEKFIEKLINDKKDCWYYICQNKNISEKFFEKYLESKTDDKVNWDILSQNENISEQFFEKYGISNIPNKYDKVNWRYLCKNKNISEKFFEKYIKRDIDNKTNKINWDSLYVNSNLSLDFFKKYNRTSNLFSNSNIPTEFFETIELDWISMNSLAYWIDYKFIEKHFDLLTDDGWETLGINPTVNVEFIEKHIDKFDWYYLSTNYTLPVSFFDKNSDSVIWYNLLSHPDIYKDIYFMEKYKNQLKYDYIVKDGLDLEIINKNNFPIHFKSKNTNLNRYLHKLIKKEILECMK